MNIVEAIKTVAGEFLPAQAQGDVYRASAKFAIGTKHGPLLACRIDYLCPDCGGYGFVPSAPVCPYCDGVGTIQFTDRRVVDYDPRGLLPAPGVPS